MGTDTDQCTIEDQEVRNEPFYKSILTMSPFKLLQVILQFLSFLVLVFLLVFTGMFGHIISDELHDVRLEVIQSIDYQNQVFKNAISGLHPHFLIEAQIRTFKIGPDGHLYIDGKIISNQKELNTYLRTHKTIRELEGTYYDDNLMDNK